MLKIVLKQQTHDSCVSLKLHVLLRAFIAVIIVVTSFESTSNSLKSLAFK